MNEQIAKGKWKEIKGSLREKWGKLTDNELEEAHGNAKKIAGQLQKKYGYSLEEAEKKVNEEINRFAA